ncbi:MAG TPA: glycosyltransferase family 4 protein, partial [Coleofasciculaceae cyanobacterium]
MLTDSYIEPRSSRKEDPSQPTIALLPWGQLWEDFYDSIGISFESFCNELTGGWQFGYIEALRLAGVRTVIFYVSTNVTEPSRFTHKPTGATICLLPAPKRYLTIHPKITKKTPSLAPNLEEEESESRRSKSHQIGLKLLRQVAPYLATPLRILAQEIRREGCQAILCQEYEYFRFDTCVLLGKLMRLPVFATFQGGDIDRNLIGRSLRPWTMQSCQGLVIGTGTEIQRVRDRYHLHSAKITQIFNPIDLEMWGTTDRHAARAMFQLPTDAQVVVWHGRVDMYAKGLDILLDAWEQVCRERVGRDLRLLLMGTGIHSEQLRQRIAALPTQNVLWIDKYINDRNFMRHFLSAGDVYAFPSRREGFPVAPIEAMACGLPVVAAEAPGVADILADGEASGGIVVARDDTTAFAQALGRILDALK